MSQSSATPVFDPEKNFNDTLVRVGYRPRKQAGKEVYDALGFKSGLEIHQQVKTGKKLFCHCPAGIYQGEGEYDAEVIRHMRPTLSELGEYDGTALMEFKTKKNIVYRIANTTACTYDVDDTPPFKLNMQALEIALEVALLLKTNIVGELHITRKQYLDGSIPTGFQRTAIVGIEGKIPLKNKTVRIIQISVEEDSCREVSDSGHVRIYSTDRLGIPLIETVTYPDMKTPDEVAEAAQYLRFLCRSTDKVRTGIGAAREDVNVSVEGGTRIEIKGVPRISAIPELTHNEAFRQKSLLMIRDALRTKIENTQKWNLSHTPVEADVLSTASPRIRDAVGKKYSFAAVNLPGFAGILSFFMQPGRMFADEISDRLKVIACLEKPNMAHSEERGENRQEEEFALIRTMLGAQKDDAQILVWGPQEDIGTAIDTIRERCRLAFIGVPNETRKALRDGTTMFERVLPGPDRMYPDTDSAPISISQEFIDNVRQQLPVDIDQRLKQLHAWEVPPDTFTYLLKHNLVPLIEKIHENLDFKPKFIATLLAHRLKYLMGHKKPAPAFNFGKIYDLLSFVRTKKLHKEILFDMLPVIYEHPNMDLESVLISAHFTVHDRKSIVSSIPLLYKKFTQINSSKDPEAPIRWIMKKLRSMALGNIPMPDLAKAVRKGGGNE